MALDNAPKVALGLVVAVVVLLVIEQVNPSLATWYIVVLALGFVVANSGALSTFGAQVQARLK